MLFHYSRGQNVSNKRFKLTLVATAVWYLALFVPATVLTACQSPKVNMVNADWSSEPRQNMARAKSSVGSLPNVTVLK